MHGMLGMILEPPLMMKYGIFESSRAALVRVAGVGIPPGLMGMPFMQVTFPITRYSASAGPV